MFRLGSLPSADSEGSGNFSLAPGGDRVRGEEGGRTTAGGIDFVYFKFTFSFIREFEYVFNLIHADDLAEIILLLFEYNFRLRAAGR